MDKDGVNVVSEGEVYAVASTGSIMCNEIVAQNRNNVLTAGNFTFKSEWQNFPEFQTWLRPVPDDQSKAWCQACEKVFRADLKSLRVHGVGRSHIRQVQTKFPEAAASPPPPAAVYNVITDRKGTYGLGILSKTDNNPTAGSTLYVNPTNPSANVLTCDPKQDKDNFVVVSMPKGEMGGDDAGENHQNDIEELHELQFDSPRRRARKKSDLESGVGVEVRLRGVKRSATGISKNSKACDTETFAAEELMGTEDLEDEDEVDDEVEEEDEDDDDFDDDDDSMYDFEAKMEKAKCSSRKRLPLKKRSFGDNSCSSFSTELATVTRPAPFWKAKAIVNGHVSELKLTDYLGRYLILFFYPQDFDKLCSKEVTELSDRISDFRNINTEIVACSVDSYLTHQVWSKMSKSEGGVAYPKVPLLSDYTHEISKSYGCYLSEAGHTLRAHYIIDTKGILRHVTMHDIQITRDISEILKLVQSFQRADDSLRHTLIIDDENP